MTPPVFLLVYTGLLMALVQHPNEFGLFWGTILLIKALKASDR